MRTLADLKTSLPKLPDTPSTRAGQGFALAQRGENSPGIGELQKVAGWIAGAPAPLDPEIAYWTRIHTQLEVVMGKIGFKEPAK
jgi:hypothetical protein